MCVCNCVHDIIHRYWQDANRCGFTYDLLLNTLRQQQNGCHFADDIFKCICYASAFRHRRYYVFGLSVRPSIRPKPEIPSFDLYMGPLVHPTNPNRFTACPSVRPERFPGICRRTHGGNGPKFYMLMYLDHLQNWLVCGHGLLIFVILALFWLSETGQICGFRAFPGERMEEMVWNFARWCILSTFRTD